MYTKSLWFYCITKCSTFIGNSRLFLSIHVCSYLWRINMLYQHKKFSFAIDTCRNSFMQTCFNCIPSSVCGTISGSRLTSNEAECSYWCIIAKTSCKMATFNNGNCMMYVQSHCDSVEEKTGRMVFRKACTAGNVFLNYDPWMTVLLSQKLDLFSVFQETWHAFK